MSQEHLLQICQQLAKQGKTPSVALIKARMTTKVSMQAVIKAIQLWKQNPNVELAPGQTPSESAPPASLEQRVAQLEKEVATLKLALQRQTSQN